jgi:cell division protein FtsZ
VDNDKLLPSLEGDVALDRAFERADEVLRQGVQGIADIVMSPGVINVDFADVKAIMRSGGQSFMAVGDGKGKHAAMNAVNSALANPLFDAPIEGASGILFNVKGGRDLTIGQVHEVAGVIRQAAGADANVIFGVVQDPAMKRRVSITLVATGLAGSSREEVQDEVETESDAIEREIMNIMKGKSKNGHAKADLATSQKLF